VGDGAALVGDGAAAVAQRLEDGAALAQVTRHAGREAGRRHQRARAVARDIERVLKYAMLICQHSEQQMTNLAVALPDRLSAAGAVLLGHLRHDPVGGGVQPLALEDHVEEELVRVHRPLALRRLADNEDPRRAAGVGGGRPGRPRLSLPDEGSA